MQYRLDRSEGAMIHKVTKRRATGGEQEQEPGKVTTDEVNKNVVEDLQRKRRYRFPRRESGNQERRVDEIQSEADGWRKTCAYAAQERRQRTDKQAQEKRKQQHQQEQQQQRRTTNIYRVLSERSKQRRVD